MPTVWSAVTALVLIFSAHGALAMGPVQSDTQFHAQVERRSPVWSTVRLCNGISKATRTICCGTNPPAWCGKRPDSSNVGDALVAGPASGDELKAIVGDPMFYVCMITSITIIYLVALAGSGRENSV
jgi:hypothetical protein